MMTKDEIRAMIEGELALYPKATTLEIARKLQLPFQIVQLFRDRIEKSSKQ